jgi:hypothetical protein
MPRFPDTSKFECANLPLKARLHFGDFRLQFAVLKKFNISQINQTQRIENLYNLVYTEISIDLAREFGKVHFSQLPTGLGQEA